MKDIRQVSEGWFYDTVYPFASRADENCNHEVLLCMRGDVFRAYGIMDFRCLDCNERFLTTRRELNRIERAGTKVIFKEHRSHNNNDFYIPYFMANHAIYPRIKSIYDSIKEKIDGIPEDKVEEFPTAPELMCEIFENVSADNLYSKDWVNDSLDYVDKRIIYQKNKTLQKHI